MCSISCLICLNQLFINEIINVILILLTQNLIDYLFFLIYFMKGTGRIIFYLKQFSIVFDKYTKIVLVDGALKYLIDYLVIYCFLVPS